MGVVEIIPTHDVYIAEAFPNRNFITANVLFAGRYMKAGDAYRSLLKFDLSSLDKKVSPGCRIKSACLSISIFRNEVPSVPGKAYIEAYRLVEGFDVNTVTWNTQPRPASYPVGAAVLDTGFTGSIEIDITKLVKGWTDGTVENLGIL